MKKPFDWGKHLHHLWVIEYTQPVKAWKDMIFLVGAVVDGKRLSHNEIINILESTHGATLAKKAIPREEVSNRADEIAAYEEWLKNSEGKRSGRKQRDYSPRIG